MKPTVLLFNCNDKDRLLKITQALLPIGVRIRQVKKEEYLQPMGYLAGLKEIEPKNDLYEGDDLEDEMYIMAGISGPQMDRLLNNLRKAVGRTNYKAMLTPTNQYWNAMELFDELKKEREMISNRLKKQE